MRSSSFRSAFVAVSLLATSAWAQDTAPINPEPATPAPVTEAPKVEPQDTAEAKLAVVLRSFTLMRDENDQLRAAQEKLLAEKASLEAQLAVAKNALPLADQAGALHEQLRQTQDQLAALSMENNQLKTKLALGVPSQSSTLSSPTHPDAAGTVTTPAPDRAPVAAPTVTAAAAPRSHVIAAGDTLTRISQQYYGTPSRWTEILAANREILRDEKSLIVGRTIVIP